MVMRVRAKGLREEKGECVCVCVNGGIEGENICEIEIKIKVETYTIKKIKK